MAESLENRGKLRKLIDNFQFAELSKSELCAQTRASSLAGGMPVW